MNTASNAFADLFQDKVQIALDRALAELRAGRPILVESEGEATMLAAVDSISPAMFRVLARSPDAELALGLSRARARAMGLQADCAISLSVAGLGREAICRMAGGAEVEAPRIWLPADDRVQMGIELCKYALLLPAVLFAPADNSIPLPIHRISLEEARLALEGARPKPEIVARAQVALAGGIEASFVVFRGGPTLRDQIAIIVGDPPPDQPVTIRLHSACITGDLFSSLRCDCGDQLHKTIARLAEAGGGVLLYLDQEGRGTGIRNKIRAYALQDTGLDTIDADAVLGYGPDERRYDLAASMLLTLGYRRVRLLTNNPEKIAALRRAGIDIEDRQPLTGVVTLQNRAYLSTKAKRAGHLFGDLLASPPRAESGSRQ